MALTAAAQMCSGVGKSGSPRLKSKTVLPWARSCRASAPAARVAEGCTSAAMREMVTAFSLLDIPYLLRAFLLCWPPFGVAPKMELYDSTQRESRGLAVARGP